MIGKSYFNYKPYQIAIIIINFCLVAYRNQKCDNQTLIGGIQKSKMR
jgi:hypothetical protein